MANALSDVNTVDATFKPFPRLPVELRLKIWRNAQLLFPRVVEIRKYHNGRPFGVSHRIQCSTPVTPLLAVNQESRYEILPFYSELSSANKSLPSTTSPYCFLFNYSLDILYNNSTRYSGPVSGSLIFPPQWLASSFESVFGENQDEVKRELRYLAGTSVFWNKMGSSLSTIGWDIAEFKKVQKAFLVQIDSCPFSKNVSSFVASRGERSDPLNLTQGSIGGYGFDLRTVRENIDACMEAAGYETPEHLEVGFWVEEGTEERL